MSDTSTNSVNVVPQQTGLISTVGSSFRQANNFYRQPGIQRALPSIAAAIVAILGIIIFTTLQTPDRTTLFASLSESEKSRVFDTIFCGLGFGDEAHIIKYQEHTCFHRF